MVKFWIGMKICVDLDGTLSEVMSDWRQYKEAPPIEENIEKIRKLKELGMEIFIYTARPWKDYPVTIAWLEEHNVPYDEILMGKERADLYIDNCSMKMEEINDLTF